MISNSQEQQDVKWMRRAIELARLSEGYTRPNPPVGAVIVKDGRLIGEGRHEYAGGDHAEVVAFDSCTESAAGATLYVTLEPCSTHGRTPPCTERIIREGVSRVVVGALDRNLRHNGRGLAILEKHGIATLSGICDADAQELVAPFFKHLRTTLPYLTLKLALTLDGCIADRNNLSRWITGAEARAEVQRMRRRADAVMVGSQTALHDNPSLLCRIEGGDNLMRVIVDSKGLLPPNSKVLSDATAERTIIFTSVNTPLAVIDGWSANGSCVELLKPLDNGHLDVSEILCCLGKMNLMHVLCEGGGGLAATLHKANLIDEYVLFYAPLILADTAARRGFAWDNTALLNDAERLVLRDAKIFGEDVRIRYHRNNADQ